MLPPRPYDTPASNRLSSESIRRDSVRRLAKGLVRRGAAVIISSEGRRVGPPESHDEMVTNLRTLPFDDPQREIPRVLESPSAPVQSGGCSIGGGSIPSHVPCRIHIAHFISHAARLFAQFQPPPACCNTFQKPEVSLHSESATRCRAPPQSSSCTPRR